jgi:hypothetical protein
MGSRGYQAICRGFFFQTFNSLIFFNLGFPEKNHQLGPGKGAKFPGTFRGNFLELALWITPSFFLTLPD